MDKNRDHLTAFSWRKDAAGYALTNGFIVRRGGKMQEYDPAAITPGLHHVFANIISQTVAGAENEGRQLSDDPAAPFHMRSFGDVPGAMLAFVNEYGFLGSDRTGADAENEELIYLYKLSSTLREVQGFYRLQRSKGPLRTALADAGLLGETITGPNLRMVVAPNALQGGLEIHYEPESLYAWMWLRTADDFGSGIDWSGPPCLYCLQSMGRGPGAYRPQAKFCTDKHRTYFDRLSPDEQKKRVNEAKAFTRNGALSQTEGA
jgi:hypothetical protein